jgi:hypothetical protein
MAGRADIRADPESVRMERMKPRGGCFLGKDQRAEEILEVRDELFRSEGIDPTWRPLVERKPGARLTHDRPRSPTAR